MPVDETTVRELSRDITSANVDQRRDGADGVTDFEGDFSTEQANDLARTLVRAALGEADVDALESQLHALEFLCGWNRVSKSIVAGVLEIDRSIMGPAELEYLTLLREYVERPD